MLWKMTNLDEDHAIHFDINIAIGFILEGSSYDDTRRSSQNPARKDTRPYDIASLYFQIQL